MDPSKMVDSKEECSSSNVSGWTMYIGSPVDDDRYEYEDDHSTNLQEDGNKKAGCVYDYGDDDSDDSIASDASSGPSHQELSWGSSKKKSVVDDKHTAGGVIYKDKVYKPKKKGGERNKPKSAFSQAQSGGEKKKTNLNSKEKNG